MKMISKRKRRAVYVIVALILGVAVYLNWSAVELPDVLSVAGQTDAASSKGTGDSSSGKASASETATTEEDGAAETVTSTASDYFAQSRLSREQARDEAIGILKETMASAENDEAAKEQATTEISTLAQASVTEVRVESLIKAKGYEDAVVFLGDDSVNVIVQPPQEGFSATDAAKIRDIVVAETGITADRIKIVEAK